MNTDNKQEQILYCNHCGNRTGHEILFETNSVGEIYNSANPLEISQIDTHYYLTKCSTCCGVSLFTDCEYDENIGYLEDAFLCYPSFKKATKEIPQLISQTYHEALKVEKISPIAFAILIRRALELLCKDQNAGGRNLKSQLDDLATKTIIPVTLSQMGDMLRTLGNISAHDSDYKLDVVEIAAMKDFFLAMLEYVYVAPAKIAKLKESMKKKTTKPKRDAAAQQLIEISTKPSDF